MSLNGHSNDGALTDAQQAKSDQNSLLDEMAKIGRQLPDDTLAALVQLMKTIHTTNRKDDIEEDVVRQNGNELASFGSGAFK